MSRDHYRSAPVSVDRIPPTGSCDDQVAVEEPLEIRLRHGSEGAQELAIAVTMRTPGSDADLARGFLFAEGLIRRAQDITHIETIGEPAPGSGLRNRIRVTLSPDIDVDVARLDRHMFTSSSCGVCGKRTIEALTTRLIFAPEDADFQIPASVVLSLPDRLRQHQAVFDRTGALHAAARFDADGQIQAIAEDVGRHNALDKLIGAALDGESLPLRQQGILVSGRTSFELMQKTVMAGCPLLAAVGGPSSLAVEMSREFNVTLVGFLRDGRFNIYSAPHRITTLD